MAKIISVAISLGLIVFGVFGLMDSIDEMNISTGETYVFSGEILSYDYNEVSKNTHCHIHADVNGEQVLFLIPSIYIGEFNREAFEDSYSSGETYTFVMLQDHYENDDEVCLFGLKNSSEIFLDEEAALGKYVLNSKTGLFICPVLILGGTVGVVMCIWLIKNKWF